MARRLLDARGVQISPGVQVIVTHGRGDGARPFLGIVEGRVYGYRGLQVKVTPSGYPYVQLLDVEGETIFERPERMIVVRGVPDV